MCFKSGHDVRKVCFYKCLKILVFLSDILGAMFIFKSSLYNTSALIMQSHDYRGVRALIVKGMF